MYNDITAVVLAGGKSIRMGTNKSLLTLGNKTIIEIIINRLNNLFEDIIIISNEPENYEFIGLPIYQDVFIGYGPLAGIHSGLINSQTERNFIISCDIPFITEEAIDFIVNYPSENNIIVPKSDGFIQQLCGIYKKELIPFIEKLLLDSADEETRDSRQMKRKCKVHSLVESAGACIIDFETEYPSYTNNLFFNMNAPADYNFVLNSEMIKLK